MSYTKKFELICSFFYDMMSFNHDSCIPLEPWLRKELYTAKYSNGQAPSRNCKLYSERGYRTGTATQNNVVHLWCGSLWQATSLGIGFCVVYKMIIYTTWVHTILYWTLVSQLHPSMILCIPDLCYNSFEMLYTERAVLYEVVCYICLMV